MTVKVDALQEIFTTTTWREQTGSMVRKWNRRSRMWCDAAMVKRWKKIGGESGREEERGGVGGGGALQSAFPGSASM